MNLKNRKNKLQTIWEQQKSISDDLNKKIGKSVRFLDQDNNTYLKSLYEGDFEDTVPSTSFPIGDYVEYWNTEDSFNVNEVINRNRITETDTINTDGDITYHQWELSITGGIPLLHTPEQDNVTGQMQMELTSGASLSSPGSIETRQHLITISDAAASVSDSDSNLYASLTSYTQKPPNPFSQYILMDLSSGGDVIFFKADITCSITHSESGITVLESHPGGLLTPSYSDSVVRDTGYFRFSLSMRAWNGVQWRYLHLIWYKSDGFNDSSIGFHPSDFQSTIHWYRFIEWNGTPLDINLSDFIRDNYWSDLNNEETVYIAPFGSETPFGLTDIYAKMASATISHAGWEWLINNYTFYYNTEIDIQATIGAIQLGKETGGWVAFNYDLESEEFTLPIHHLTRVNIEILGDFTDDFLIFDSEMDGLVYIKRNTPIFIQTKIINNLVGKFKVKVTGALFREVVNQDELDSLTVPQVKLLVTYSPPNPYKTNINSTIK